MPKYISKSDAETKSIAAKLAKMVRQTRRKNNIFALTGELGAGKTTFVQGFAQGLGIEEKIISPTFVLIRQHQIPKLSKILYHIDLYRLTEKDQFKNLGLEELLNDPNHLILIEWAEKLGKNLPKDAVKINIFKSNSQERIITIS